MVVFVRDTPTDGLCLLLTDCWYFVLLSWMSVCVCVCRLLGACSDLSCSLSLCLSCIRSWASLSLSPRPSVLRTVLCLNETVAQTELTCRGNAPPVGPAHCYFHFTDEFKNRAQLAQERKSNLRVFFYTVVWSVSPSQSETPYFCSVRVLFLLFSQ